MADRLNDARALRVMEILGDFRTLQTHINSHVTRTESNPADAGLRSLPGYALLRQSGIEARGLLVNPGSLGIAQQSPMAATEAQKAALQRVILDVSARRFQAHRIYLRAAAATRWIMERAKIAKERKPNAQALLKAADQKLQKEINEITDQYVFNDLRNADRRKGYWLNDDPTLERILAWIRTTK